MGRAVLRSFLKPATGHWLSGHGGNIRFSRVHGEAVIPAFMTRDGALLMASGVMGGATQPQGHAQIVANLVDFGMNLPEAGDAPRICHSGSSEPTGSRISDGGWVAIEQGYPPSVIAELCARGHDLRDAAPEQFGGYQAIWRDPATGVYHGASESRKDDHVAVY